MLGLPLSNKDQLKIRFSNLSLSASKLLDFHPRSSFFFCDAQAACTHSRWAWSIIPIDTGIGLWVIVGKNKCHNDDIITIITTWSPKIALVLGNYIVNQVGNLCRGHPDKRIPHFEASLFMRPKKKVHAKEEICKSICIFKNFWDISWNFPAGFSPPRWDSTTLTSHWL